MKKIVNIRHFAGINVLNALTPSIRSSFQVVDVKYRWRSLWRSGFSTFPFVVCLQIKATAICYGKLLF